MRIVIDEQWTWSTEDSYKYVMFAFKCSGAEKLESISQSTDMYIVS